VQGKDFKGDPPILQKIAAGLTTSAIGITVASRQSNKM